MDRLEESLKRALERKAPAPGFEERVAARVGSGKLRPSGQITRLSAPRWWAAAAAIAIAAGSGVAYRRHEGEAAKEQLMTAMRITAVKLHRVQTHVREVRQ
jgi:hypothetical protein